MLKPSKHYEFVYRNELLIIPGNTHFNAREILLPFKSDTYCWNLLYADGRRYPNRVTAGVLLKTAVLYIEKVKVVRFHV